jgi:hypothetical protein
MNAYLPTIIADGERLGIKPAPVKGTLLTAAAIEALCLSTAHESSGFDPS